MASPAYTPALSRDLSSQSLFVSHRVDERSPLLAGDVEQGEQVENDSQEARTPPNNPQTQPQEGKQKSKWEIIKMRSRYYVPSTAWLPAYSLHSLWGDLAAGITVATIIIPQSMSYATGLAKLDASTGLFSAAIPGIIYAFLGTSKHLNVGPEASLSLLIGQAVNSIRHGDPHEDLPAHVGLAISTMITFQVGLISFLLGLFRLGFIDVVLSRALLRGFVTAVAVVIMIEQLVPMLGLAHLEHLSNPQTTIDKFLFLLENAWTSTHALTAAISFASLTCLILARAIKTKLRPYFPAIFYIPEVFLFVVLTTLMSNIFDWDDKGVSILGAVDIHRGGSLFQFPLQRKNLEYLKATTSTSLLIAVAGFIDSITAAKQNASRFGYSISPNRELVALGAGNLAASFLPGTLPAYGAITRSKVNADTGGTTQMASFITSSFVILSIVFLLPALYYLPKCILAAIIGLVVYSILAEAPHDIVYYWKMEAWVDFGLMMLTFLSTLLWSVEVGIVVSVTVSLLLVVRKSSKTSIKILGRIPGTNKWKPVDENPEAMEDIPGVLIVRIRESLHFANAGQIKERLRRLELYGPKKVHPSESPSRDQASIVVFHMADVEHIDASAVQIFIELVTTYKSRGVQVHFAHLRTKQIKKFQTAGLLELLGEEHVHESVADTIRMIETGL